MGLTAAERRADREAGAAGTGAPAGQWHTGHGDRDTGQRACPGREGRGRAGHRGGDLEALVGEWLTVPDLAERLGLAVGGVRRLIADRELWRTRIGERRVVAVPAKFVDDEGPRPELKGTFTVLADGGMDDDEIMRWLYTPDPTLPVTVPRSTPCGQGTRPRSGAAPGARLLAVQGGDGHIHHRARAGERSVGRGRRSLEGQGMAEQLVIRIDDAVISRAAERRSGRR